MQGKRVIVYLLVCCLCIPSICRAQVTDENGYKVIQRIPVFFTYTDIDELLKDKIIHSAIELRLTAPMDQKVIYVSIEGKNNLVQTIGLKLNLSASSSIQAGSPEEILLGRAPVKLLSWAGGRERMAMTLSYDVILHAATKYINPGSYNFEIIFSTSPL